MQPATATKHARTSMDPFLHLSSAPPASLTAWWVGNGTAAHAALQREPHIMTGRGTEPKGPVKAAIGGALGNGRLHSDGDLTAQRLPVTQQLRDEVTSAQRQRGMSAPPAQLEALRLIEADTLTTEELDRVAAAFDLSPVRLLELTNSVHEVGTTGGPG